MLLEPYSEHLCEKKVEMNAHKLVQRQFIFDKLVLEWVITIKVLQPIALLIESLCFCLSASNIPQALVIDDFKSLL